MAAAVTLSSTTLAAPVGASGSVVKVASTSGISAGTRLYVDKELMTVVSLGVDPYVNVLRGVDGTASAPHVSSSLLYVGPANLFFDSDPVGTPGDVVPASPWINVRGGRTWVVQGDSFPAGNANRWWQQVVPTYGIGPLGVRTSATDPTS